MFFDGFGLKNKNKNKNQEQEPRNGNVYVNMLAKFIDQKDLKRRSTGARNLDKRKKGISGFTATNYTLDAPLDTKQVGVLSLMEDFLLHVAHQEPRTRTKNKNQEPGTKNQEPRTKNQEQRTKNRTKN